MFGPREFKFRVSCWSVVRHLSRRPQSTENAERINGTLTT